MKKLGYFIFLVIVLTLMSACSNPEEMTDYVEVSFSGTDTMGTANYEVNEEQLIEEVFDYNDDTNFADEETLEEINNLEEAYKIQLEPDEDLSNGDTVSLTVSVDEEKTDKIQGGEKEVTVENLEEPDVLTSEDVENNLVLNFIGANGKGAAKIDNTFNESPLSEINFKVKNNGELENGDKSEIIISDETRSSLNKDGYVLDDDFNPSFTVEGLYNVAEKPDDIENLEDIERMINEKLNREYDDKEPIRIFYETEKETTMYRQFNETKEDEDDMFSAEEQTGGHGNLIKIYSVEKEDEMSEETEEFTAIIGFTNIRVDDQGKADLSEMEEITSKKDHTYSLKSVIQLYEGEGHEEVNE